MSDKISPKGFSEVKYLITDISRVIKYQVGEQYTENSHRQSSSLVTANSSTHPQKTERQSTVESNKNTTYQQVDKKSTYRKFIVKSIVAIIVLGGGGVSYLSSNHSKGNQTTVTSTTVPSTDFKVRVEYSKPTTSDRILSTSEIRWCLRAEIVLNTIESLLTTQSLVKEFNIEVARYNTLCSSYQYYDNDFSIATRDINKEKNKIIEGANAIYLTKSISAAVHGLFVEKNKDTSDAKSTFDYSNQKGVTSTP